MPRPSSVAVLLALAGAAATAHATWSIVLVDTRTGEVALGSATCLTNFDLQANTPVLLTGVGGATAQSAVDSTGQNRVFIRDGLIQGVAPSAILSGLSTFDGAHQSRQYGIVDARGRAATFSGTGDGQWAGGRTGQVGTIVYAIQGNVLTGAPVVDMAVAAITNTPGDLAEKLMAGMEAARAMGGDGRCSCNPSDPTGCGSPPPTFIKAAHIAYMIIARAGDRDGSNGIYRSGSTPYGLAIADVSGPADARPDIITGSSAASTFSVLRNLTPPGASLGSMTSLPTTYPGTNSARALVCVDLNGDGRPDVVAANNTTGFLGVMLATPTGFAAPLSVPVGLQPAAVAAVDFDGDGHVDLAVANTGSNSVSILLGNGLGAFTAAPALVAVGGPQSLAVADFNGDGLPDLAVAAVGGTVRVFLNAGAGGFTGGAGATLGNSPTSIAAADFNHDGLQDIAVTLRGSAQVAVLLQQASPPGTFATALYTVGANPEPLAAGDVDHDGVPDLVCVGAGSHTLDVLRGRGDGTFEPVRSFAVPGNGAQDLKLVDLNGDGLPEAVITPRGVGTVSVIQNIGGGSFNTGLGCATGSYFMDFNIANRQATDPDPVFTLRASFNTWRATLVGHPDAVQSTVSFNRGSLRAGGAGELASAVMTIRLLDWHGDPASANSIALTSTGEFASAGPLTPQGGGVYTCTVTSGTGIGTARFTITADDGRRTVTLMPSPSILVTPSPDLNHDGSVNVQDFFLFLARFAVADSGADFNGDGRVDAGDFLAFLAAFAEG
jgi:hypothetical protein